MSHTPEKSSPADLRQALETSGFKRPENMAVPVGAGETGMGYKPVNIASLLRDNATEEAKKLGGVCVMNNDIVNARSRTSLRTGPVTDVHSGLSGGKATTDGSRGLIA